MKLCLLALVFAAMFRADAQLVHWGHGKLHPPVSISYPSITCNRENGGDSRAAELQIILRGLLPSFRYLIHVHGEAGPHTREWVKQFSPTDYGVGKDTTLNTAVTIPLDSAAEMAVKVWRIQVFDTHEQLPGAPRVVLAWYSSTQSALSVLTINLAVTCRSEDGQQGLVTTASGEESLWPGKFLACTTVEIVARSTVLRVG